MDALNPSSQESNEYINMPKTGLKTGVRVSLPSTTDYAQRTPKGFLVGKLHAEPVEAPAMADCINMFNFINQNKGGQPVIHVKIKDQFASDTKQRNLRSQIIPDILRIPRQLTDEEYTRNEIHAIRPGVPYYLEDKKGRTAPLAQYLSIDHVQKIPGLMDIMAEMQAIILNPVVEEAFARYTTGKHGHLSSYTTGITIQPSAHTSSIQLSKIVQGRLNKSRKEPDTYLQRQTARFNELVGKLSAIVIPRTFPEEAMDWDRLWESSASLTLGDENNRYITSVFINVCKVDAYTNKEPSLREALGAKSDLHCDKGDEKSMLSMNLFLTYLPKSVFPGRFFMPLFKMEVSGAPFGLLLFKGTYPHIPLAVAKYTVPEDSSLRYRLPPGIKYPQPDPNWIYQRTSIIMYPKTVLMNIGVPKRLHPGIFGEVREKDWNQPDWKKEEQEEMKAKLTSWAVPTALVFWGTSRNFYTWKMRFDIRENLEQYRKDAISAETLAKKYAWQDAETKEEHMPSIGIAQACLDASKAETAKLKAIKDMILKVNIGIKFQYRLADGSLSSRGSGDAHITWFALPGAEKSQQLRAMGKDIKAAVEYSEAPEPRGSKRKRETVGMQEGEQE